MGDRPNQVRWFCFPRIERHEIACLMVMAAGFFLGFSFVMPRMYVTIAGLLVAVIAYFILRPRRIEWRRFIIALAIIAVMVVVFPAGIKALQDKSARHEIIDNARLITAALNEYSADNDQLYPLSFAELLAEGYLDSLPDNPHYKNMSSEFLTKCTSEELQAFKRMEPLGVDIMRDRVCRYHTRAGEFAYLPRIVETEDGLYTATGYSLLVMGLKYWEPGWWQGTWTDTIVIFYHNNETGATKTWR